MAAICQYKYSFMNLHKRDTLPGSYRTGCHWYCDPLDIVKEMGLVIAELLGSVEGADLFKV